MTQDVRDSAIRIERVVKDYGRGAHAVRALNDVSLEIRDNEFFTLLGPSGCGKTTLLRIIAGFEPVTAGRVLLFGQDIARLPPHKRPVNTVFQHYALFPHMTVAENVAFALRRLKRPEPEIRSITAKMLEVVKLADYGDRRPSQLSGGQQQRVALARALAPQPKALLLDEPLSALDLKLRQAMRLELKQLQKETGITFIFVTHDQKEALSMSDRIAVMSQGEVQQVGAPSEIYEFPANRFVADFIGDANFIDGEIIAVEGGRTICRVGANTVIAVRYADGHRAGARVTLFLRPEKVALSPADTSAEGESHRGRVVGIDYLGDSTVYEVEIADHIRLLAQGRSSEGGGFAFVPGDAVTVVLATDALRVFPK